MDDFPWVIFLTERQGQGNNLVMINQNMEKLFSLMLQWDLHLYWQSEELSEKMYKIYCGEDLLVIKTIFKSAEHKTLEFTLIL